MEPTSTSFARRDIRAIEDHRPPASGSDARPVDGQDPKIWRRDVRRKSLKLPSYARWPWTLALAVDQSLDCNLWRDRKRRCTHANAASRVHGLVKQLGLGKAAVVGHDIGLMVAYGYAAQFPEDVDKLVLMDAFLPGVEGWEAIYNNPTI